MKRKPGLNVWPVEGTPSLQLHTVMWPAAELFIPLTTWHFYLPNVVWLFAVCHCLFLLLCILEWPVTDPILFASFQIPLPCLRTPFSALFGFIFFLKEMHWTLFMKFSCFKYASGSTYPNNQLLLLWALHKRRNRQLVSFWNNCCPISPSMLPVLRVLCFFIVEPRSPW